MHPVYKSDLRIYSAGKQKGIIRIKHFKFWPWHLNYRDHFMINYRDLLKLLLLKRRFKKEFFCVITYKYLLLIVLHFTTQFEDV